MERLLWRCEMGFWVVAMRVKILGVRVLIWCGDVVGSRVRVRVSWGIFFRLVRR